MIIAVASGKGGTGKTSITASFAVLAGSPVLADCDVDAADLHLILAPTIRERHEFRSGNEAVIRPAECIMCGKMLRLVPARRGRAGWRGGSVCH
jgi:MinD superfamily P-loop ATPase